MSLDRPALPLSTGARGVQDARRWVVEACTDIGRPDLAECAQLGTSELVTNALLHADAPITVRLRGTREHPRIEVRDGSSDPPRLPVPLPAGSDPDDLLLTFGRGLTIVARASTAWGADLDEEGKVVWFTPARDVATGEGVEGVITGWRPQRRPHRHAADPDAVRVEIRGIPLAAYAGFQRHFRELRREVRLLALAHEAEYPLAKNLSDLFGTLERQLRDIAGLERVEAALQAGRETTDVEVSVPRGDARTLNRFLELLDLADEFCREERLLSLARSPEQRRFQAWFFGEFVRQAAGEAPVAWHVPADGRSRSVVS
ncbi:ATP-binding protein [Nocardioides sp. SYSU D00038]|uniref:ATP-binding protein n=1 Tax=Nocardioides sp. SYSU D00038 TaxID=2812554 RepID=UPI001967C77D|nr:ATP-binding protein [Nocardioides sp. SYSU D00038]